MSIKNLFSGATFVGEAAGDRQTYFVFSVDAGYIVVARRSRNNFSITVVERDAPQAITRKFKGQRITVKDLKSKGGRADLFGEYFDRLNALVSRQMYSETVVIRRFHQPRLLVKWRYFTNYPDTHVWINSSASPSCQSSGGKDMPQMFCGSASSIPQCRGWSGST